MPEKMACRAPTKTSTLTTAIVRSCWTGVRFMPGPSSPQSRRCLPGQRLGLLEGPGRAAPAALLPYVVLVLLAELLQRGLRGGDGGVAERAQRLASDRVADVPQDVQLPHRGPPGLDAVQEAQHPARALPAGRALAAGLVLVEVGQALGHPDHAGGVVHDDGPGGAEHGAGLA